ncbi:MAG: hypothetical protein QM791_19140 [Ferruginibacter sp.]
MKKIINTVATSANVTNSTITVIKENTQPKVFTTADLWNIQRQGKTRSSRRFI